MMPFATLCAHRCAVTCLAWDGASLWSGDETGHLIKWNLNTREHEVVYRFDDHILAIRLNYKVVYVHLRRGEIFKVGDETKLFHATGVDGLFIRMSQIVNEMAIIPANHDAMKIISLTCGSSVTLPAGGGVPFDCLLLEDQAMVAYDDGSLRAYDLNGNQLQRWQPFPTSMTCISAHRGAVWMGSPLKDLVVLRDGHLHRMEMPVSGFSCLMAVADDLVVVASWDGKLRIVSEMQIIQTISYHSGLINDMLLIEGYPIKDSRLPTRMHFGRNLVVASADGSITLWDIDLLINSKK